MSTAKPRSRGIDLVEVRSGRERAAKIEDKVELLKLPENKPVQLRLISPIFMYAGFWVSFPKKKGEQKPRKFYMPSPSYDPIAQTFDSTIYDPFNAICQLEYEHKVDYKNRLVDRRVYGYALAIVRGLQRQEPARKSPPTAEERRTGFKDKDSDTWTCVRVIRLSKSVLQDLRDLAQTNVVRNSKTGESKAIPLAHPRGGMDIRIKYDPTREPAKQYQVLPVKRTPLTEEEQKYLTFDLDNLETPPSPKEMKESYERWYKEAKRVLPVAEEEETGEWDGDGEEDGGFEDDLEQEEAPRRSPKGKRPAQKPSRKAPPADDDDWGDDDGEGDEADEGEDWGDDADEEEEPPRRQKPSRKPAPKSGKPRRPAPPADDDWGDEDGEDGGDGDDWDAEGGEEDWGDEDVEQEPPRRKKPAAGRKPAGKPSRKAPPPSDDDWGDEDGEDSDSGDDWGDDDDDAF